VKRISEEDSNLIAAKGGINAYKTGKDEES